MLFIEACTLYQYVSMYFDICMVFLEHPKLKSGSWWLTLEAQTKSCLIIQIGKKGTCLFFLNQSVNIGTIPLFFKEKKIIFEIIHCICSTARLFYYFLTAPGFSGAVRPQTQTYSYSKRLIGIHRVDTKSTCCKFEFCCIFSYDILQTFTKSYSIIQTIKVCTSF